MNRTLKIAGACLNQTPIDWVNNQNNISSAITAAKAKGVDILCLPELCITGYGCEDLFLSEWLPVHALQKLQSLLSETEGIAVCLGLPVRIDNFTYNSTCFIADGKIQGFYAKQHLANDGVHYESRWFAPWETGHIRKFQLDGKSYPFGHTMFNYKDISIGFEICEDAWNGDRSADLISNNTDLILNPSASHFAFGKAKFRENLVVSSSKKFNTVYVYTNLLGNEAGQMIYDGDILIASHGTLVGRNRRLSFQDFNLLCVEINFDSPHTTHHIPVLPDFPSRNHEFSNAASLALFDYMRKSKSRGFVLSLSGGADSSTIAVLVAEIVRHGVAELGKKKFQQKSGFDLSGSTSEEFVGQLLTTAYQGTKHSSQDTLQSARTLANSIGAVFYHWKIDDEVNSFRIKIETAIGQTLNWERDDITLQNIQARARGAIIWTLANLNKALLLATSNRSEGDVGYATMDGDTSGSISPISGVSKHFILQWLRFAERELDYQGLQPVNKLTPTAELRPVEQHQTDEDDLMPYEALLKIEREAILHRKSPKEVHDSLRHSLDAQMLKDWIQTFFRLWARNQWKRERYAPGFHFDDFNTDPRSWFRFPILSGEYEEELKDL